MRRAGESDECSWALVAPFPTFLAAITSNEAVTLLAWNGEPLSANVVAVYIGKNRGQDGRSNIVLADSLTVLKPRGCSISSRPPCAGI